MARCMKSEKQGHFVFYGAMVCEGVIALIWAAAGCSLYEVTDGLNTGLAQALAMGQSKAIYDVCSKTMGGVGIALAMIVLWAASMYLFKEKKNYWITAVPATFMSAVSATYFVLAPECLGGLLNHKTAEGAIVYNTAVAYPVGILFAIAMLALFIYATKKQTVKKTA